MSARLFLTRTATATFSASVIVTLLPSRDLTTRVLPSSFSTVPRIRVGVPSGGGAWASAGTAMRPASMAARSENGRMRQILPVRGCAQITSQKWRRVTIHISLNHDPLDLIEAELVPPAIVELGRARRSVVCHRRGLFERAAVLVLIPGEVARESGVISPAIPI